MLPILQNNNKLLTWGFILILGLMAESCILLIGLSFWIEGRQANRMGIILTDSAINSSEKPIIEPTTDLIKTKETKSIPTARTQEASTQTIFNPPTGNIDIDPSFTPTRGLPDFSRPPGGKIVYTCFDGNFDQICIMSANGTDKKQLTYYSATSFYPSLSPDGKWVVFSSRVDGNFEIYLMDTMGKNIQQLTNDIGNLFAPEISPKGNRIAFTHESGGYQSIWVMKINGQNPHPLFESSGFDIDPTWGPTSMVLAFASGVEGKTNLFLVNADGKKIRPVLKNGITIGGRSSWSPDGQRLAYYAGESGNRNIFIVDIDGNENKQVTNGGDNLAPSYSPTGEWIAFTSYRMGNNKDIPISTFPCIIS
jgi:TolB protein